MGYGIMIKSLDPLRAKKTFIRKKLGHTMVSAIKSLISDPKNLERQSSQRLICRKIPKYFNFVKKMNLNVISFPSSQNILHDLKGPKVKYNLHYR